MRPKVSHNCDVCKHMVRRLSPKHSSIYPDYINKSYLEFCQHLSFNIGLADIRQGSDRRTHQREIHVRPYCFLFRKERPIIGFVSFQYFDRTNEVFESLLKCDNVDGLESADTMLVELQERQISIGTFMLIQCLSDCTKVSGYISALNSLT